MEKYKVLKRAHVKACKQGLQRVYSHNDMAVMLREIDRVDQEKEEIKKAFDLAMVMIVTHSVTLSKLDHGTTLLLKALHEIPMVKKMICEKCDHKDHCERCEQ